jgi:hypothetical protein
MAEHYFWMLVHTGMTALFVYALIRNTELWAAHTAW